MNSVITIPEVGNDFFKQAMGRIPEQFRKGVIREWEPTPFMIDVDVYERDEKIMHWLRQTLGRESSPMHRCEGCWRRSNVTIGGKSWFGFKTQTLLNQFQKKFPNES